MFGLGEAFTSLDNLDALELYRTIAGEREPHVSVAESALGRSEVAMLLISLLSFTPASEHQRRLQKSLVGMFSIMVREMTAVRESGGGDVRCTIVPEVVEVTSSERIALLESLTMIPVRYACSNTLVSNALAPEPTETKVCRTLHTGETRSDCSIPTNEGGPPDRA